MTSQLGSLKRHHTRAAARPLARRGQAAAKPQGSARIIPMPGLPHAEALRGARQERGAPREAAVGRRAQALPLRQSQALQDALAFARALMAQADEDGAVDYYDRWGNKICLKP